MNNIYISENYGVNPSLMICPICGKGTGVALFGRLPGDAEAPRKLNSEEPCDSCKDGMRRGIMLVEVTGSDGALMRTGRLWCITEEAVKRAFRDDTQRASMLRRRAAFLDTEAAKAIGLPTEA